MLFHSTRGKDYDRTFEEVLMQGLAADGGLFIPDTWPQVDLEQLKTLDSFIDVAKCIVPLFTKSSFSDDEVLELLDDTWHDFSRENFATIHRLDDTKSILELFHGPTAAFKDFGLQLAAAFFNKSLLKQNKTAIVLGATSGDTGSAAIDACKRFDSIKSFILLPDGNMSEVQRRQMTTVDSPNVFTIRVSGTFDDCQDIVKQAFNERSFLKDDQFLLAVNSINWVRIIGQICYYFYASLRVNQLEEPLNFSVPTGNFGNVFACYSAYKMGMPLNKILVAVNDNNILHRFFSDNDYSRSKVSETLSPSMDISVASNFERLIYDFFADRDSSICDQFYKNFPKSPIDFSVNVDGVATSVDFTTKLKSKTESDIEVTSFYIQDQIDVNESLKLMLGARLDTFDITVKDIKSGTSQSREDDEVSPRAGIIFKPAENISWYVSYSESFLPRSGEQFKKLTADAAILDPDVFENTEFGVKWEITPDLYFTAAYFDSEQTQAVRDSETGENSEIVGLQVDGFDLELKGDVNEKLSIAVGVTSMDGETSSGGQPREIPDTQASLWATYQVNDRFGWGFGFTHQGESNISNNKPGLVLPDYIRVDFAAYYMISDEWSMQFNVENLTDELYFPHSHSTHQASVGEPMNARISIRRNF